MLIILLAFSSHLYSAEVVEKKEWFGEINKEYLPFNLEEPKCKKIEKTPDPWESQDLRCEIFRIKIF